MNLKKLLAGVLSAAMVVTSVVMPQDIGVVSAAGEEGKEAVTETISGAWWTTGSFSKGYILEDDATRHFKLTVKDGGNEFYTNFSMLFSSNTKSDKSAPDAKYGIVRSDLWGWDGEVGSGGVQAGPDKAVIEVTTGSLDDIVAIMKDAEVDVKVQSKEGKIIYTLVATGKGENAKTYAQKATFNHAAGQRTYVSFACDTATVTITNGKYYTKTAAKAATCAKEGNQVYWSCEEEPNVYYKDVDCTEAFTGDEWKIAIDPNNHEQLDQVERVEPSCVSESDGREAYYTCPACSKNFRDEAGTQIVSPDDLTIPFEHQWIVDEEHTTATCTQAGTATRECSVCNKKEDGVQVDKLGHDFGNWEVTTAATCTEDGVETRTCKRTGCTEKETRALTKLEHRYEDDWEVTTPATCTTDGVESRACKNTGCTETETRAITKLNHRYEDDWEVTTPATCTTDGVKTRKCKNTGCTETETEVIPATGHTITKVEAKAATATTPGNIEYYTCSGCSKCFSDAEGKNAITLESTVIPATNNQGGSSQEAKLELSTQNVTLYTGKQTNQIVVTATVTGASQTVSWTSSAPKVASVANGTIRALKKGKAVITVKANGIEKKINVTVKNPTIKVAKGKKSVSKVTVKRKKSVKLNVTVSPSKSGSSLVKLSKKDKKYVKVTLKKGKLTIKGLKKGKATIKIKSGKGEKKIKVTVK